MNETILDVISKNLVVEATSLQPVTRTFKRFLKSKVVPYLTRSTGQEWQVSNLGGKSSGRFVKYYVNTNGSPRLEISWEFEVAKAANEDEFNLRIYFTKDNNILGQYIYGVQGQGNSYIKQNDLKDLNKLVPEVIITAIEGSKVTTVPTKEIEAITKEIEAIKSLSESLDRTLSKVQNFVPKFNDIVKKALKSKDPQRELVNSYKLLSSIKKTHLSGYISPPDRSAKSILERIKDLS